MKNPKWSSVTTCTIFPTNFQLRHTTFCEVWKFTWPSITILKLSLIQFDLWCLTSLLKIFKVLNCSHWKFSNEYLPAYTDDDTFDAAASQLITQQRQPFHRLRRWRIPNDLQWQHAPSFLQIFNSDIQHFVRCESSPDHRLRFWSWVWFNLIYGAWPPFLKYLKFWIVVIENFQMNTYQLILMTILLMQQPPNL